MTYNSGDRTLNCPGHYSRFDVEKGGQQVWGQATQNLPQYTLRIDDKGDIYAEGLSLVRELARLMPDKQIARLLNRAGKPTGRGNGWTQTRVTSFRNHYDIRVHRAGEWAERGELTLEAAAQIMEVNAMAALRMIKRGIIPGRQLCEGAPWVYSPVSASERGMALPWVSIQPASESSVGFSVRPRSVIAYSTRGGISG